MNTELHIEPALVGVDRTNRDPAPRRFEVW